MVLQNYYTISTGELQGIFPKFQKIFSPLQKEFLCHAINTVFGILTEP